MLHKFLATSVLVTLLTSMTFAQEAPGKGTPVASEMIPVMNSAPAEPIVSGLSEIVVVPEMYEAVISFTTESMIHAGIQYGVMASDYPYSISTEPQTQHAETLGDLKACTTYYYRVHVGDESREGDFKTLCPVAKKVVKKPLVKKTPAVVVPEEMNNEQGIMNNEEGKVINNKEEIVLNAAPEKMNNDQGIMTNEESIADTDDSEVMPEAPVKRSLPPVENTKILSVPADDTRSVPVALLLFAVLSGAVVAFFSLKKKKKWYQK